MPKPLSDTQLIILSAAAAHPEQLALPVPKCLTLNGGALRTVLSALLSRSFLEEVDGNPNWPGADPDGPPRTLRISAQGLEVIGVETDPPPATEAGPLAEPQTGLDAADPTACDVATDRARVRVPERILGLLQRPGGADMAALQTETGWQAHSIRAVISGFRKRGIPIARNREEDGRTVYQSAVA